MKILIVLFLNIGNLSSKKAQDFVDDTTKKLKNENFDLIVIPQYDKTFLEIYEFDDPKDLLKVKNNYSLLEFENIKIPKIVNFYETDEETISYLRNYFGWPVVKLDDDFDDKAKKAISLGEKYNIFGNERRNFCEDLLSQWITKKD